MSEQFIQNKIFSIIKAQFGFAETEVAVLNRCIDLVYKNNSDELVTIEIKLKDWKQALRQATDHQLYADKSYICLPRPQKKISEELLLALHDSGIGLIWFEVSTGRRKEVSVEEYVSARKTNANWPVARKRIESALYA
jgi:hypothetical protein